LDVFLLSIASIGLYASANFIDWRTLFFLLQQSGKFGCEHRMRTSGRSAVGLPRDMDVTAIGRVPGEQRAGGWSRRNRIDAVTKPEITFAVMMEKMRLFDRDHEEMGRPKAGMSLISGRQYHC
jgi:hypothetical protein